MVHHNIREHRGYNERLFSSDFLRAYYHLARFKWAAAVISKLKPKLKLVELGCFDGRLSDFVGTQLSEYVGLDANWEGGLDLAKEKFAGRSDVRLILTDSPDCLLEFPDGYFDAAVALETLEHLPPDLVSPFLAQLARITDGQLIVSVPNELGPIFLMKYAAKWLFYGDAQSYSAREIVAATLRESHKVARDDHKGFDYRDMVMEISRHFDVIRVEGLAGFGLPPALSPTVGVLARSKSIEPR